MLSYSNISCREFVYSGGAFFSGLTPRAIKDGPSGAFYGVRALLVVLVGVLFLCSFSGCNPIQPQQDIAPTGSPKSPDKANATEPASHEPATDSAQQSSSTPVNATPEQPNPSQQLDPQSPNNEWPLFRGNGQCSGVSATELPEDLEVLWEYKVPGSNGAFEGTAVIAKHSKSGKPIVYIGDLDGTLYALDLVSGDLKWKTRPVVMLAPLENSVNKKPREHTAFSFSASPAYHQGRIFIGDVDGIFYCFDEDGELQWFYETESDISSSPNFYDGGVLFGSQDANLYLLDTQTGEKKWQLETPDQIRCSVTVAQDRAFVAGCDGFFHIVDLKTGTEAGKVDIKSPTQSTPAVMNELVYFGTEQDEFIAVDWKTATGKWTFSDENGPAPVRGCAAVTPGHVVFGARNRFVYSVDPQSGVKNWGVELKAKVDGSPVIVGQRVYVGSTDGRFYVLSLKNGQKIWEKQFNGGFVSSPAVASSKLVVATDRGVVYCLGAKAD